MITEREISLEDAVRKAKPVRFAIWITSGKNLEKTLAENFRVSRISVSWITCKPGYSVALGTQLSSESSSLTDLGTFANLEKVKENFPQLFEVTGNLRVG